MTEILSPEANQGWFINEILVHVPMLHLTPLFTISSTLNGLTTQNIEIRMNPGVMVASNS